LTRQPSLKLWSFKFNGDIVCESRHETAPVGVQVGGLRIQLSGLECESDRPSADEKPGTRMTQISETRMNTDKIDNGVRANPFPEMGRVGASPARELKTQEKNIEIVLTSHSGLLG
jgi:hypothetical protein